MDEQTLHDEQPAPQKLASRAELEALLRAKNGPSGEPRRSGRTARLVDPLEQAMREHPGLTREEAERMAEAFGF
jgi:hypothetical protein